MNYLAHIWLSGKSPLVQIGNFIGDSVKGKSYNQYPRAMKEGILLHRAIDDFADNHSAMKEAVLLFKPDFGRYAAVLTDICFDHILASDFRHYSGQSLRTFSYRFYYNTLRYYRILPPNVKNFMWHFILTNRLSRYAYIGGIRKALEIMVRYKSLGIDPQQAVCFLEEHKGEIKKQFDLLIPDLHHFAREYKSDR